MFEKKNMKNNIFLIQKLKHFYVQLFVFCFVVFFCVILIIHFVIAKNELQLNSKIKCEIMNIISLNFHKTNNCNSLSFHYEMAFQCYLMLKFKTLNSYFKMILNNKTQKGEHGMNKKRKLMKQYK